MSNIEDTIYDLPNEEYHRGERFKDFLSSTQIKRLYGVPKVCPIQGIAPRII